VFQSQFLPFILDGLGQAIPSVPWKETWTAKGRFCWRPSGSAENVQVHENGRQQESDCRDEAMRFR
jgi:hypothetical protein